MSWTHSVIWECESPDRFKTIEVQVLQDSKDNRDCRYGRLYSHGSLGNDETNNRYIASIEREIPFHGSSSYAEVLKDDLRLMKLALAKNSRCLQFIDRQIA